MRLIDADAIQEKMNTKHDYDSFHDEVYNQLNATIMLSEIRKCPTVDAEPVRHAHWVKKQRTDFGMNNRRVIGTDRLGELHEVIVVAKPVKYDELLCSRCGAIAALNSQNYCPRCGAIMDEEV